MTISTTSGITQAMLDAGLAQVNQGNFVLKTGQAGSTLATLPLHATLSAFQPATTGGGVTSAASRAISASGTPTPGTIGWGELQNAGNTQRWAFSVGVSGDSADMTLADKVIPNGATSVTCSGITITLSVGA